MYLALALSLKLGKKRSSSKAEHSFPFQLVASIKEKRKLKGINLKKGESSGANLIYGILSLKRINNSLMVQYCNEDQVTFARTYLR
jgi:hypothetical protein